MPLGGTAPAPAASFRWRAAAAARRPASLAARRWLPPADATVAPAPAPRGAVTAVIAAVPRRRDERPTRRAAGRHSTRLCRGCGWRRVGAPSTARSPFHPHGAGEAACGPAAATAGAAPHGAGPRAAVCPPAYEDRRYKYIWRPHSPPLVVQTATREAPFPPRKPPLCGRRRASAVDAWSGRELRGGARVAMRASPPRCGGWWGAWSPPPLAVVEPHPPASDRAPTPSCRRTFRSLAFHWLFIPSLLDDPSGRGKAAVDFNAKGQHTSSTLGGDQIIPRPCLSFSVSLARWRSSSV